MTNPNQTQHPLLWAKLHSDGVFLGLLGVLSGVRVLIDPTSDDLAREVGNYSLATWRGGLLLLGGLAIVFGFVLTNLRAEIVGRIVMVSAVLFSTIRGAIELGWTHDFVLWNTTILTAFGIITYFRIDALTTDPGYIISIPPIKEQVSAILDDELEDDGDE